jgi:hypothetical protein
MTVKKMNSRKPKKGLCFCATSSFPEFGISKGIHKKKGRERMGLLRTDSATSRLQNAIRLDHMTVKKMNARKPKNGLCFCATSSFPEFGIS